MKSYYLVIIFLTGFAVFSCTKTLELEPVSEISSQSFWKTESDVQGILAGMYSLLETEAGNNLFTWGEARSDAMGPSVASPIFQNWYLNLLTPNNSQSNFVSSLISWDGLYRTIHHCNLILKNVPNIEFAVEANKNLALAEAYSMRAYVYFVMARTWGGVPIITEPVSGNLDNIQKARDSVEDVFQFIKDDIDKAISLFPDNKFDHTNGRARWSLPALYALQADVYLWTAKKMQGGDPDLTIALNACNEVQKSNVSLLSDFESVFDYSNKGNNEIVFAVRRTYEESPDANYSIYCWAYALPQFLTSDIDEAVKQKLEPFGGAPYWAPSDIARNIFNEEDQRKDATFVEIYTHTSGQTVLLQSVVIKYNGTVISGIRHWADDYVIYRYSDILLMKAEAKNALNQDPSFEINEVRKRAYGEHYDGHIFVSGGKDYNDQAILEERFRELMFEGKRWWDLLRFDKAFDLVPSLQDRKGQDHLMLFPIPMSTISLNDKLVQNPGYDEF